ncbi:MAG TPA: FecR family protein, partial [Candidatus Acidoferrum sp.]
MTLRTSFRVVSVFIVAVLIFGLHPIYTAASHARIIRLSLVQGDVRILHDSKGDPLANDKAPWERAELNLPIRQHDVLATDNGRAEVEFENGAMAFINENSVLEFFDLSLDDGSLTTRLILRQGTGSFYVNPARDDYFSVTGGDFTAEAAGRANFRMDNFDEGSTVAVVKGQVNVVHKNDTKLLAKGQSFTMSASGAT